VADALMDFWIAMRWPFAACLVLTGIHVYLGIHVVARKVIFVDLALAQIAALGTAVGILLGYDAHHDPWELFGYSFAFSCLGALLLTITRPRSLKVPHEAIIGIVYAVAFAAAVVVLSRSPTGPEELRRNLEGNILWVTPAKVKLTAGLYAAIGLIHVAFRRRFLAASFGPGEPSVGWDFLFYLTFGFVITSSVAMAGVFLVFSYLVIPAVGAMLLADRIGPRLAIGWIGGALISFAGIALSWKSGLPTSPLIVVLLGGALAIVGIVRRIVTSTDRRRTLLRMGAVAGLIGVFAAAVLALSKPEQDPYERAMHLMHGGDNTERIAAMNTLEKFPQRRDQWLPLVAKAADDPNSQVRAAALRLLGVDALIRKLSSTDAAVRADVLEQMEQLPPGDPAVTAALLSAAGLEPEVDLRIEMYDALLKRGEPRAIEPLIRILADPAVPEYLRQDAVDHLRAHLPVPVSLTDWGGARQWWESNRERIKFDAAQKRFFGSEQ
jgi:zinc/manganese transport system permease protein